MKTTFFYTILFCSFFALSSACKNKNSPPPPPPAPHGDSMAPSLGPKIFDTLEQQIKFPTSSTSSNIEIVHEFSKPF